jgi:hypothetical protein
MTATHSIPQILQSAELKLFYGSFGFSHFSCNFSNAFFFREAHLNHAPLVRRQFPDGVEKLGAMLCGRNLGFARVDFFLGWIPRFA